MKPLTSQFATGCSLSPLPHPASVTKPSLSICTKPCEALTFLFHQPAQTGDGKGIIHLESLHFSHYLHFHPGAMLHLTVLPGDNSEDSLYFMAKICFLTSGIICNVLYFLFGLLLGTQLFAYFFLRK